MERSESAAAAYARSYVESLRSRTAVDPSPVQHLNSPPKSKATRSRQRGTNDLDDDDTDNVHELDAIPAVAAMRSTASPPNMTDPAMGGPNGFTANANPYESAGGSKPNDGNTHLLRIPPQTPVLLPEHRYCWRDEFIKPYRTHHCRLCGTVSVTPCFKRVIPRSN